MLPTIGLLVAGGALLIGGAELLVRGASRLAAAVGLSPLVIGLTVVALGTSAPELAVSVGASAAGHGDIAVGNVVGSNIFNVLLILGLSAVIAPLTVPPQMVRLDVPVMIGASLLLWGLALDGRITRWDGAVLFGVLLVYLALVIRRSRRRAAGHTEGAEGPGGAEPHVGGWWADVLLLLAGLGLLVLGSRWLVGAAVEIATALGVSPLVIGLTVVAGGTSLPEAATSALAAFRGQPDIAVGNVVGSNLFNILAVLGLSGLVAPGGVPVPRAALVFDLPVMVTVAVACFPVFVSGLRIGRREGLIFLGYFAAYIAYLVLSATRHDALPAFSAVMWRFVVPLTALALAATGVQAWRKRSGPQTRAGSAG